METEVMNSSTSTQTMTSSDSASSQAYTILRIKRKRNEEPLDALVVESRVRRKKSKGGVGVFQYAQTVEEGAWDNAERQKDIQDKISRLARETAVKAEWKATTVPSANDVPPSPTTRPTKDDAARRYTIVGHEDPQAKLNRFIKAPPKVYSSKELEQATSVPDFKMYDAIPASMTTTVLDESSEMDNFLPMLNDYLKIHDTDPNDEPSPVLKKSSSGPIPNAAPKDDYVWDVFYHRPATLSEWNEAANVATLTGLPTSFDGYDSTSDSDEEFDEADEDSNAEEYYKNDYPEEEDNSDEFHEHSEFDELAANDSDSGDDFFQERPFR